MKELKSGYYEEEIWKEVLKKYYQAIGEIMNNDGEQHTW